MSILFAVSMHTRILCIISMRMLKIGVTTGLIQTTLTTRTRHGASLQTATIMNHNWKYITSNECFSTITPKCKIEKKNYSSGSLIPVISQEEDFIKLENLSYCFIKRLLRHDILEGGCAVRHIPLVVLSYGTDESFMRVSDHIKGGVWALCRVSRA